jgi:hypothetical protein
MRTPRRRRPTEADLATLRECLNTLGRLMTELRPATPEYRATERAYDEVMSCGRLWTGNEALWRTTDGAGGRGPVDGFVKRPEHEKWPG